MKFNALLTVMLALSASFCFAQSEKIDGKFNLGLEAGFPAGKAGTIYNAGIGGSLKYEYLAGENFYLSLSAGYTSFGVKDSYRQQQPGSYKSSYGFIPIKIGGKLYLSKKIFSEVQLGNTFRTATLSLSTGNASALTFSPGIGYSLSNGLELGLRYEGWLTDGLFSRYSLREAYRFKL
jgi:hypothetical protein